MPRLPRPAVLVGGLLAGLLPLVAAPAHADPDAVVGGPLLGTRGVVADPGPGVPAPPKVSAAAYVVADLGTGEVLAAKSAHRRLPPASTQKMLTALALLPRLDPEQRYVGTRAAADVEGSRVGIYPGGRYTVHQLFEGLFLMSGNDAAHALAESAGGVDHTVDLMNAEARGLQALDTRAANPSGLDAPGQYTSAYDLALIARAGLARDDFRGYVGTVNSTFPGKGGKTFQIWNQNRLLARYPGAFGVKTGYTSLARSTFAGAARQGDRELVVTLLHAEHGAWREAGALLDWGFAQADRVRPVGRLVGPVTETTPSPAVTEVAPAQGAGVGVAGPSEPVVSWPAGRAWTTAVAAATGAGGAFAVWWVGRLGPAARLRLRRRFPDVPGLHRTRRPDADATRRRDRARKG